MAAIGEIPEQALARAHSHLRRGRDAGRVDAFEAYFEGKTQTRIEARDGAVEKLTRAQDVGLAVRVLRGGRPGFAFTTVLDDDAIRGAVDLACEIAAVGEVDPHAELPRFTGAAGSREDDDERDVAGLAAPVEAKRDLALRLEAETRAADARVRQVRAAAFTETDFESHLLDRDGRLRSQRGTRYSVSVTCKAEGPGGDGQMGGDYGFAHRLADLDPTAVAREAARSACELLGAGPLGSAVLPAILRNSVVAELIEFVAASFSAEAIDKGHSIFSRLDPAGFEGAELFSPHLTLVDDGRLAGGWGTSRWDAEGTPQRVTPLIERGRLRSRLSDLYHSRKLGLAATGSASRSLKAPPTIGTTNLVLESGARAPEAMIADLPRGILITDLMALHTANPVTGDFSLGASGILIEGGRLTRPVRGFAVAGNILTLLRSVDEVAADFRNFGGVGAASVRVTELSVSGS